MRPKAVLAASPFIADTRPAFPWKSIGALGKAIGAIGQDSSFQSRDTVHSAILKIVCASRIAKLISKGENAMRMLLVLLALVAAPAVGANGKGRRTLPVHYYGSGWR